MEVEVPAPGDQESNNAADASAGRGRDAILSWKDALTLFLYATACMLGAAIVSTYEDFDVTHTRPSPSTLRLPTTSSVSSASLPADDLGSARAFNFIGAATRGMGWGPSDRGIIPAADSGDRGGGQFFEEWYGTGAATQRWMPSYNEIMLQHRSERVPRWNGLEDGDGSSAWSSMAGSASKANAATASKEQIQQAVLRLYKSLDELDELKLMADEYMWDDMKERLRPTANTITAEAESAYALPMALEYSMDVLKSAPSHYASFAPSKPLTDVNVGELPDMIGFDWGSCAWRHCGAKADAQEAIAELYGSVGMLEPFECRFIIDVVERSIRDVLTVVPDDLKPYKDGSPVQVKPYEPYVSKSGNDGEGMGLDYDYIQALADVRVDLSMEE